MKNSKKFELRERARRILGLERIFARKDLRESFRRQIFLIHPDRGIGIVDDIDNLAMTKLVIQAYGFLTRRNFPTTMLEDDKLVSKLIGDIGPTKSVEMASDLAKFYDDCSSSIWPVSEELEEKLKYRFKGV
ncbi:MAG: hypothetical protein JW808_03485 [Victivallales bacterium]|nr:hypothetical protein [Victivallales bacterium]